MPVTEYFIENVVPENLDVAVAFTLEELVLQHFFSTQGVPAVYQQDLLGDVGQIQRFLDGGVPPADHGDLATAVEEAVTGRAGADALAEIGFLRGESEVLCRSTGRDNQCVAGVFTGALEAKRAAAEIRCFDMVKHYLGIEPLRMFEHALHEVGPLQSLDIARPVFDVGRGGKLASLLNTRDDDRCEIGAGCVDCRGVARRAGAENDQSMVLGFAHSNDACFGVRLRDCCQRQAAYDKLKYKSSLSF